MTPTSASYQSPPTKAIFSIPCSQDPSYFRRSENEPSDLLKTLIDSDSTHLHRRIVVHGGSGVGKSASVNEFAHRFHNEHPERSVFWLEGGNPWSFSHDLLTIGIQASLFPNVGSPDQLQQLCPSEELTSTACLKHDLLAQVTDYLSSPQAGKWLLIVDGVNNDHVFFEASRDDLPFAGNMPGELPRRKLVHYLPYSRSGTIIFITQHTNVGRRLSGTTLEVPIYPLTLTDGEKMLRQYVVIPTSDEVDFDEEQLLTMVNNFGRLPLNILLLMLVTEMSGDSAVTWASRYRSAYINWVEAEISSSTVDDLDKSNEKGGLGDSHRKRHGLAQSIDPALLYLTRVFEMCLEIRFPRARRTLLLGAWFDSDAIPLTILQRSHTFLETIHRSEGAPSVPNTTEILSGLGFVENTYLRLPSQFRAMLIRSMRSHNSIADKAMEAMCCVANVSTVLVNWYNCFITIPQVLYALNHAEAENGAEFGIKAALAERTCLFLIKTGMKSDLLLQLAYGALRDRERQDGPDSIALAVPLQLAARIHVIRSEFAGAEAALHQALQRCQWGEHEDMKSKHTKFSLMNMMVFILKRRDKHLDAILYAKETLDHALTFCAEDDELVLCAASELAGAYAGMELHAEAEASYSSLLKKLRNKRTLSTRMMMARRTALHNYIGVLFAQRKFSAATAACKYLIASLSQAVDRDQLVMTLVWLVKIYHMQDLLDLAKATAEKAVTLSERVSSTGTIYADGFALEWLGIVLDSQGKTEAGDQYVKAIRSYEDTFGLGDARAKRCLHNYEELQKHGPGHGKFAEPAFEDLSTLAPQLIEILDAKEAPKGSV